MARRGFRERRKGATFTDWPTGRSAPVLLANIGPQIVRVCYMFRCPDGSPRRRAVCYRRMTDTGLAPSQTDRKSIASLC